MEKTGKVYLFGNDINTDVIIPARYLTSFDKQTLAAHCMEDADKEFSKTVRDGDVIVGGKNFGSGSSREHAPLALKAAGVQAIIAKSFARIFYRNCINIGLLVIEDDYLATALSTAEKIKIDYDSGTVTDLTTLKRYPFALPPFVKEILSEGGLAEAVKKGGFNV